MLDNETMYISTDYYIHSVNLSTLLFLCCRIIAMHFGIERCKRHRCIVAICIVHYSFIEA